MGSKRKSRLAAKSDATAASEDSRRTRKRTLSESGGDFAEDDVTEEVSGGGDDIESGSASGGELVGEAAEELRIPVRRVVRNEDAEGDVRFLGESVAEEEAKARWPNRYQTIQALDDNVLQARCHFTQAEVDGQIFCLEDDAYVMSEEGKEDYICRIIEFFEAVDGSKNFTALWYYRASDTDIKTCGDLIDNKRIFISEVKDHNPIDCLVKKLRIVQLSPEAEFNVKKLRSTYDYYVDKKYLIPYTSFVSLPSDATTTSNESGSTISSDADNLPGGSCEQDDHHGEKTMLDLYSGCGAMSTGLCLGANSCGVKLVTKWAVDINPYACESLKLNHPETQVRNESAEDFLSLLKEWEQLCQRYLSAENNGLTPDDGNSNDKKDGEDDGEDVSEASYEVEKILAICYGDPNKNRKRRLYFEVTDDCPEKLKEFVINGYQSKILPLPGTVDVICGGPPCQGISGFNRFRNTKAPLEDPKNKQLIVFMDIVDYLRPKFVLMENVVDILKFCNGYLFRYALGRLVAMDYQARMGMMAAGAFGLPQFRMRMFMWGALPTERLPQYPLPTHKVINRGVVPLEFEGNTVVYNKDQEVSLKKELFLGDAISDLPEVENNEKNDEIPYSLEPQTEFQRFIRLPRNEMPGCLALSSEELGHNLYDHRPFQLNQDDYERGANFRDLPGVRVRPDNKVEWDPEVERKKVSSGKFLVPDYAMTFVGGTSSKPFGRLWWDETVPTVVTRAEPHNQAILHPLQNRVLSVRENARLQGFPDYYRLLGPVKERYIQVGNAVAVPVARALGYSLALAFRGLSGEGPLLTLPDDYPAVKVLPSPAILME
ncbi:DNA (Cytosine-5)-methyltransferase [Striga asiatica]|uniref:DNA (cytosine-5-)-methyltransferase n=1 Tax=Striga asiatica TaxID=4170 RepID=A0A5A7RJJ9_STRAF|nr:DNA (Cytosine-5)-methyltransferase [Striga asiatica]